MDINEIDLYSTEDGDEARWLSTALTQAGITNHVHEEGGAYTVVLLDGTHAERAVQICAEVTGA